MCPLGCEGVSPPAVASSLPSAESLRVIRVFLPNGEHVNYQWQNNVASIVSCLRAVDRVPKAQGVQHRATGKRYMRDDEVPPMGEYDIVMGEATLA